MTRKRAQKHMDGMYNLLSGLGGAADKATYTRVAPTAPKTEEELTDLYRENTYVAKVCDTLPRDCIKKGVTIKLKGAPEEIGADPFKVPLEKMQVLQSLAQAHIWAKLYGGAGVILGISDMNRNDREIKPPGSINFLLPVTCYELKPEKYISDWGDPKWGQPRTYTTKVKRGDVEAPTTIHNTRVLRFEGITVPPDDKQELECVGWGDSVVTRCWPEIRNLTVAEQAMASAVHDLNVMVLKIRGLAVVATSDTGTEELQKRLLAVNLSKSICNAVLVDADEEDATYLTREVKGFTEMHDRFRLALSAASSIPHTRLFGDSPSGFSTDDKSGSQNWAVEVASSQKSEYEPGIRQLVDIMMMDPAGPTKGKAYEYTVEWPPLIEATSEEKSKTEHNKAQANALMQRSGVLNPEEIWEHEYATRGWEKRGEFRHPEEDALELAMVQAKNGGGAGGGPDNEWTGERLRPPTAEGGAKGNTPLDKQLSESKGNTTKASAPVKVK